MRSDALEAAKRGASFLDARANERLNGEEKEIPEAQEWKADLSSEIDYIIPFDCVARDIQQWILESSIYPQPAISYASALCTVATVIGRSIAYENIKGNLMFICTAESGEGKDWPFKASRRILDALKLEKSKAFKMASGAALTESVSANPSLLLYIDEFGEYLNIINGKNANQYSKEIIGIMTELYTSASDVFVGKQLKGLDPVTIIEPNLSVLGLTTERQIFDGLKTSDLANGSIARFSVLFGVGGLEPKRISGFNDFVPGHIIDRLQNLKDEYCCKYLLKSEQLERSLSYDNHKYDMTVRLKKKSNAMREKGGEKANFVPMFNRIAVRCIQQAMLIDQCRSIEVLQWLEELEIKSNDVFMKKFLHLGSDNENERLIKTVERAIKMAGKNGISKKELYGKTRTVETGMRMRIINNLLDCDRIFTKEDYSKKSQRPTLLYFWKK